MPEVAGTEPKVKTEAVGASTQTPMETSSAGTQTMSGFKEVLEELQEIGNFIEELEAEAGVYTDALQEADDGLKASLFCSPSARIDRTSACVH